MALKWLSNPILKTVAAQTGGAVGAVIATALDTYLEHPREGTAAYLVVHPITYIGYSIGVGLIHNWISATFPPGQPPQPK